LLVAGMMINSEVDREALEDTKKQAATQHSSSAIRSPVRAVPQNVVKEPPLRPPKPFKEMTGEEYMRYLSNVQGI